MTALPSLRSLEPGQKLGDFQIVAPLKAGGMATLFLGRRLGPAGFARHVAIKVVHPHLATDPSFVRMFLDEARLSAQIRHPNVVHVEALGEIDGFYYLVMEYVHGCTLHQFLRNLGRQGRRLTPALASAIAMKVADGLHAAHESKDEQGELLGVVHRDVSPQNILLGYDGHIKLIDFGVAKAKGRSGDTSAGSLKGKIRYMAPEQAWGREVDRRTDVYALGIVLWECLTYQRMFQADNDFQVLEQVRHPAPAAPSKHATEIDARLDEVCLTALAADPAGRFATAQALRRALGAACPEALQVETDDLSALLHLVMADDIAKAKAVLPSELHRIPSEPTEVVLEEFTRAGEWSVAFDEGLSASGVAPAPRAFVEATPVQAPALRARTWGVALALGAFGLIAALWMWSAQHPDVAARTQPLQREAVRTETAAPVARVEPASITPSEPTAAPQAPAGVDPPATDPNPAPPRATPRSPSTRRPRSSSDSTMAAGPIIDEVSF